MVIDSTNETIELLLGASVAATQADFSCVFDEITPTILTPNETNGSSNNTTPVTIVGSPSSGNARQVREVLVINRDTATITVTIRYNNTSITRTLFKATLQTGDCISFNIETGWKVTDANGLIEMSTTNVQPFANMRLSELYANGGNSTSSLNAIAPMMSMGKAAKAYSTITFRYNVTTAGATITWAEMAVYRLCQPNVMGTQQAWYRLGYADTSAVWNSLGLKSTTISVPGCRAGDDLYVIFGINAVTTVQFRGTQVADVNSSNLNSILNGTTATAWRPSTQPLYQASTFSNSISAIIFNWTGA